MSTAQIVAIALVLVPTLAFVLWPLVTGRREGAAAIGSRRPTPPSSSTRRRPSVYRALKELAFDHEAGHLSDDDYEGLRARYESRAAEILAALDALGPAAPAAPTAEPPPRPRPGAAAAEELRAPSGGARSSAPSSSSSSVS